MDTATVSHEISVSGVKQDQLVRLDTRISRFVMKNGLDRGLLSLRLTGGSITALPFDGVTVEGYPPFFTRHRENCRGGTFSAALRGATLDIPVNLGQLVIGDYQHLVGIPEHTGSLTLSVSFSPAAIILKLTSINYTGKGRVLPLAAGIERELHDEEGRVTIATPNTSCFLVELAPDEDDALLELLGRMEVPPAQSFYTASYRAALFGQWRTLPYREGRLVHAPGKRLCLVHLTDEPLRHDLYILQESARNGG